MTQVIQLVTRRHVFHVSDRLLSQKTPQGTEAFDANCNKAVVFCATDAHVVASYTGRAYLDHIPTDTFIAQSLLGSSLTCAGAFIGVGCPESWIDIGQSVERLRRDLTEAFQRLPDHERSTNFQVSIYGWRQRRRPNTRVMPLAWELYRDHRVARSPFQIKREKRWWGWDRGFTIGAIPDIPEPLFSQALEDLRERGGNSPEDIQNILVETLRKCADGRPQEINYSCTQIMLTPTKAPHARVKCIPDIRRPVHDQPAGIGYTPWIVAPPMAYAPARMRGGPDGGGWTNVGTGYSWKYEGPLEPVVMGALPATGNSPARNSHSSQPRKDDPQKPRQAPPNQSLQRTDEP